ncbi:MAG TPA: beta-phosphoglucomutase family hydrolase [Acidimicrobiia bacterium]|nr:beta-phosphoglucomutase family hydrolase [Acidimicrobiia bacterium]
MEVRDVDLAAYEAVLFDLDGVLTPTALVHAKAWKTMFDTFLAGWSTQTGVPQTPFDAESDYHLYVDGKKRSDGVRSFLASRGIELPDGDVDDPPEFDTVYGLGHRKNRLITEVLEREGIDPYPGSARLLDCLKGTNVKLAVVSSSHNAEAVLTSAGIADDFDIRVDGHTADRLDLPGKPAPDMFLVAAYRLDVAPSRSVVMEDALAGVQAGRAGNFGLVVGVDRVGQTIELLAHGADVVVDDLADLLLEGCR